MSDQLFKTHQEKAERHKREGQAANKRGERDQAIRHYAARALTTPTRSNIWRLSC